MGDPYRTKQWIFLVILWERSMKFVWTRMKLRIGNLIGLRFINFHVLLGIL